MRQAACLGVAAALAALVPAASAAGAHASSFEPEATLRRADRVAVLSLARAGNRLVAAGERGRILLSDDQGGSWKVAGETVLPWPDLESVKGFLPPRER